MSRFSPRASNSRLRIGRLQHQILRVLQAVGQEGLQEHPGGVRGAQHKLPPVGRLPRRGHQAPHREAVRREDLPVLHLQQRQGAPHRRDHLCMYSNVSRAN